MPGACPCSAQCSECRSHPSWSRAPPPPPPNTRQHALCKRFCAKSSHNYAQILQKIPRLFYRFLFFVKSRNLQNDLGFRLTWNLFRLTWNMSAKMFHSTILDKIGCVLIKRFWVKTYSRINLKHARRAGCDLPKNRFKQIRHGSNLNDQDVQPLWEGFSEGRRCSRDTYPESLITGYILINEDHPRQPCPA
jgi:hypothetical protein